MISRDNTDRLSTRLFRAATAQVEQKKSAWRRTADMLNLVSPLATLDRGYAIVTDSKGQIVSRHDDVDHGETVWAKLSSGRLQCRVESTDEPAEST